MTATSLQAEADLFGHIIPEPPAGAIPIRATKRLADWRRELTRAFQYLTQSSPAEAEALWQEYERRDAEGPDWLRYHSKSEIKEAPKIDLDRNALVRLRSPLEAVLKRVLPLKPRI